MPGAIATITYKGSSPVPYTNFTTQGNGWNLYGVKIPQFGSPPNYPQIFQDVLQIPGCDGARYLAGGAHFPVFQMMTVTPVSDFPYAGLFAREFEMLKACTIGFTYTRTGASTYYFQVIDIKALPTASIIPGVYVYSQNYSVSSAQACVDATWTLQSVLQ